MAMVGDGREAPVSWRAIRRAATMAKVCYATDSLLLGQHAVNLTLGLSRSSATVCPGPQEMA